MTVVFEDKGVGSNALNEFQNKESRPSNLSNFNRKEEDKLIKRILQQYPPS